MGWGTSKDGGGTDVVDRSEVEEGDNVCVQVLA